MRDIILGFIVQPYRKEGVIGGKVPYIPGVAGGCCYELCRQYRS